MTPNQLIAFLNAMTCGDLESMAGKLEEARRACLDLEDEDLSSKLSEAREALLSGDLKTYRKRLETAVARLGHMKSRKPSRRPVVSS